LTRPSTSLLRQCPQDVDARDTPGHDEDRSFLSSKDFQK
jgi:hypothetical protein